MSHSNNPDKPSTTAEAQANQNSHLNTKQTSRKRKGGPDPTEQETEIEDWQCVAEVFVKHESELAENHWARKFGLERAFRNFEFASMLAELRMSILEDQGEQLDKAICALQDAMEGVKDAAPKARAALENVEKALDSIPDDAPFDKACEATRAFLRQQDDQVSEIEYNIGPMVRSIFGQQTE